MSSSPLPPDLRARLLAEAKATPAPTRPVVARRRLVTLGVGFAWTFALTCVLGLRIGARPAPFVAALALSWALVATAASAFVVTRGRSMLGRSRPALVAALVATPALLLATLAAAYAAWPEAVDLECGARAHAICLLTCMVLALGPLTAFARLRAASDPVHPALTAVALAVSAGAWASFASLFHCPFSGVAHQLVGHVLPVVALALGGAWTVTRVVALRARGPHRERA